MSKIISHYGKAYLVKDDSLYDIYAPFYEWLRTEGFEVAWYKGHYDVCNWCFVNADAKLFAYGMPGVAITAVIGEKPISMDEFKKIYLRKPVRDKEWKMTYSLYRAQFEDAAEFEKYYAKLSEEEVRELIESETAGITVKAAIFQKWKDLHKN